MRNEETRDDSNESAIPDVGPYEATYSRIK